MSQYLPTGGFKWDNAEKWERGDILSIGDDEDIGYFFEVDLEYPIELHDKHDQYPFGPEKKEVKADMLSKYQTNLAQILDQKVGGTKLLLTLNNKDKYVCHYRQLKQMLSHGLILKKVHTVLQFEQSPWLKPYIDHNTRLR